MKSEIHNLVPGTDQWLQFRLERGGASEAAAMLGLSAKTSRSELLRMKHTRLPKEFSDWVQTHVLDHGHEVEALARPLFEHILGEELYPVVFSKGRMSASTDGLTMSGRVAWEHKQWNDELARSVMAGVVPEEHMPQCQQVLYCSEAERLVFAVSDGTMDRIAYTEVRPDPVWFERLEQGWAQFWADLEDYELPPVAAPTPVGKAPDTLPALLVTVQGAVTASNLAEFKSTALAAIRSVNRELTTDQHFADAEKSLKWCEEVESRLKAAKEHALSQTATIDALFKTMDDISAEARQVRLDLEKLVKARKESIRGEIVAGAVAAFTAHTAAMNCPYLPRIAADFAGVIKNKRTVASLQDAVDTELARVKIEANGHFQRITQNLATLAAHKEHAALFPDTGALVLKAADDLAATIDSRVAKFKADEEAKKQAAAVVQTPAVQPAPVAAPAVFAAPIAAAANEPATLKLGTICDRLGFTLTAAFLAERLGIEHSATDKAAKLYRESDFPRICAALLAHVGAMRVMYAKGERQEVAA